MSTAAETPSPSRILGALAFGLVLAVLLTSLVLAWVISTNRALEADEIEHVHATYNIRSGLLIYEEFRQPHPPLLYAVLWPLVDGEEPVASFRRSRVAMALILTVLVLLVGLAARRLAGDLAGLAAAGLALLHSTFIERGIEVRTDGPMALLVTAALLLELSGLSRRRRFLFQALLLSLAFLLTPKSVFACVAFGSLWLLHALRERRFGLVAAPMAVWFLPLAITTAILAALGNLDAFWTTNFGDAAAMASRSEGNLPQGLGPGLTALVLWAESRRNLLFVGLAVAGFLLGLTAWRREGDPRLRFVVWLALWLFASIWVNPFPYPYFHVTVLPAFFLLAGLAVERLAKLLRLPALGASSLALLLLIFLGAAATSAPRLLRQAMPNIDRQFETLREVQRVTDPDDAVFDMVGLYFRPDGHPYYLMTSVTMARYAAGLVPPIVPELRRRRVMAFIFNYRIAWLDGEERAFLEDHYVHYDGNIFLHGWSLGGLRPGESLEIEVLADEQFRYDGDGVILIGGEEFRRGPLAAGRHTVTRLLERGPDRLILDTPEPIHWPARPPKRLFSF